MVFSQLNARGAQRQNILAAGRCCGDDGSCICRAVVPYYGWAVVPHSPRRL